MFVLQVPIYPYSVVTDEALTRMVECMKEVQTQCIHGEEYAYLLPDASIHNMEYICNEGKIIL